MTATIYPGGGGLKWSVQEALHNSGRTNWSILGAGGNDQLGTLNEKLLIRKLKNDPYWLENEQQQI